MDQRKAYPWEEPEKFQTYEQWKPTGLLYGLKGETRDEVMRLFKVACDKLKHDGKNFKNDNGWYVSIKSKESLVCLLPSIRHIYTHISTPGGIGNINRQTYFQSNPEDVSLALSLTNIDEIISELDNLWCVAIPTCKFFLSSLDIEAEITSLFCYNYVARLAEKIRRIKKL